MSAMSRFGPTVARTMLNQQQRHMATAVSIQSDPIQKLFLDKIKEFKVTSKGLDARHEKLMGEEMLRLKRVFKVEDENKLAKFENKFPSETEVSLHDLDTSKEFREKVYSGEYQKQIATQSAKKSVLIESIPYREPDDFHYPLINKPDKRIILDGMADGMKMPPASIGETRPDYELVTDEPMTPEKLQRELRVFFGDKMPTIDGDTSPERDHVNFPRFKQPLDTPPTVLHIIPESWFKFFYPKTGVTGPYAFGVGFITFLMSKEWLVMEHELLSGLSLLAGFAYVIPKYGPPITKYLREKVDQDIREQDNWQKGNAETLGKISTAYTNELKKGDVIAEFYEARKQDVELQAEHEYRRRLQSIYEDTKRRLNYLVSVADSTRQINQTYLVNWVISNVHSSIGPKQEEDYLASCIGNLKQLAQKNANSI